MKKIMSLIMCIVFLVSLTACSESSATDFTVKKVAVSADDNAYFAAREFVNTLENAECVSYNTSSDVVIAVENSKADYAVLDEFEYNNFIRMQRNISIHSRCEFTLDYCAYFSNGNHDLSQAFNYALSHLKSAGIIDKIVKCYSEGGVYEASPSTGEKGELIMLCDPYFEYINYLDSEGNNAGIEIAIAREICSYLGYSLQIATADFDELFMKLQNGDGDFVMSGAVYNEERAGYYISSDIYFTRNYYVVNRK